MDIDIRFMTFFAYTASQAGTPVSDSDVSTFDIRGSPSLSRRRVGSFNSNYDNSESPGKLFENNTRIWSIQEEWDI